MSRLLEPSFKGLHMKTGWRLKFSPEAAVGKGCNALDRKCAKDRYKKPLQEADDFNSGIPRKIIAKPSYSLIL